MRTYLNQEMTYRGGGITPTEKKTRESNIELFRIVTMLLIIAHHYVVNSGLTNIDGLIAADPLSWRSIFLLIFGAWGKTGINCFVLITGYYMCTSQITAKKFAKLLLEVMFYRIILAAIFWITRYEQFTVLTFLKLLIPITVISTGFPNAFIVFYLFIPFLNILIKNLSEKQHLLLLFLCFFLYVFLGTLPGFSVTFNYVSWFCVLYIVSSYLRLYPKRIFTNTKIWLVLSLCFVLVSISSVIACTWLGAMYDKFMPFVFVMDSNCFLAFGTGLSLFLLFKNIHIGQNKLINWVAASTFGVLLIHTNRDTMRQWLWQDILNVTGNYRSSFLVIHAVLSVLVIFLICTVIDHLRIAFIEAPFFKLWDKHWDGLIKRYKLIETKICTKMNIKG